MKKFLKIFVFAFIMSVGLFDQANAAERNDEDFIGASYQAYVVNCDEWISLRYAPSVYSEVLEKIPLGTKVVVYDGDVKGIDGFYPVEYAGFCGYCLKEYLQYAGGAGAPIN